MESVTFTPHYTLRAVSSGTDSNLKIRYHARISNTSGEDWNDVSLSISTAQASETTVIPRMSRWTVDLTTPVSNVYRQKKSLGFRGDRGGMPQQMQYVQSRFAPGNIGTELEVDCLSYAATGIEEEVDMTTAAAEVSEGITSTFVIPGRQTIKDGEKSHTVVIRDLVLEGKFANICVPKLKEVAYLQVPILQNPH